MVTSNCGKDRENPIVVYKRKDKNRKKYYLIREVVSIHAEQCTKVVIDDESI